MPKIYDARGNRREERERNDAKHSREERRLTGSATQRALVTQGRKSTEDSTATPEKCRENEDEGKEEEERKEGRKEGYIGSG